MVTSVQRSLFSAQFDKSQVDQPLIGVLNSEALSDGITPVYLQDKLYKITDKNGSEPRIACAISLLNNLENESKTHLQALKQGNRIGALHVQDGEIKSLTLTKDQIQMIKENGVNELAFKVNNFILLIKEEILLREYTSEEEYQAFTRLF